MNRQKPLKIGKNRFFRNTCDRNTKNKIKNKIKINRQDRKFAIFTAQNARAQEIPPNKLLKSKNHFCHEIKTKSQFPNTKIRKPSFQNPSYSSENAVKSSKSSTVIGLSLPPVCLRMGSVKTGTYS